MAIPIATGGKEKATIAGSQTAPPSPLTKTESPTSATMKPTTINAMLQTSQRSCARSTLPARGRRTNIDATPAAVNTKVIGGPADKTIQPGHPGNTANGLVTVTPDEELGMLTEIVGAKADSTARRTTRATANRASRPQRPIGSRPAGKVSVMTNNTTMSGLPLHACTTVIASTNDDTAPLVSWTTLAGVLTEDTANDHAPSRRSQPIELRGRRIARNPPTRPYGAASNNPVPLVRPTTSARATTAVTAIRPGKPKGRPPASAAEMRPLTMSGPRPVTLDPRTPGGAPISPPTRRTSRGPHHQAESNTSTGRSRGPGWSTDP